MGMEFLGVGLPELAFIVIIALIVLGPKDMVAAGRTLGKTLRKIVTSPTWKAVRTTGQELQNLPTRLMREAGLEEDLKELDKQARDVVQSIDPRRIARSFDEKQTIEAPSSPAAAHPFEADAPPGADPGPDSSPENPQA
jgi:Sec-independent protein translocase protein TatA